MYLSEFQGWVERQVARRLNTGLLIRRGGLEGPGGGDLEGRPFGDHSQAARPRQSLNTASKKNAILVREVGKRTYFS